MYWLAAAVMCVSSSQACWSPAQQTKSSTLVEAVVEAVEQRKKLQEMVDLIDFWHRYVAELLCCLDAVPQVFNHTLFALADNCQLA